MLGRGRTGIRRLGQFFSNIFRHSTNIVQSGHYLIICIVSSSYSAFSVTKYHQFSPWRCDLTRSLRRNLLLIKYIRRCIALILYIWQVSERQVPKERKDDRKYLSKSDVTQLTTLSLNMGHIIAEPSDNQVNTVQEVTYPQIEEPILHEVVVNDLDNTKAVTFRDRITQLRIEL